jgi:PAS domain S-box-containing protein
MARKGRRVEQTVVMAVALAVEVALILLFLLGGDVEGLQERFTPTQLLFVSAVLLVVYVLYVELRVKEYGRALVDEKVKTHTLVESLPEGVVLLDDAAAVITANERACRHLGMDAVDSIGKDFPSLFDDATAQRIRQGFSGRTEASLKGSGRRHRLTLLPLREGGGKMVMVEEAAAPSPERELPSASPRETSALLASLWRSVCDMEREIGRMDGETRRRFAAALVQARKSLNLFEAVDGPLPRPDRTECEVEDAAREALERSMPVARAKGIRAELSAKGETRAKVDRPLLMRALDEIIFNACAYTPEGGSVRVALEADASSLALTVTDSGIGIAADELPRVFDPGFVGANQVPETRVGKGIGLSLAKRIVEAHGGSIWIESQPGRGTRISLNLPRG